MNIVITQILFLNRDKARQLRCVLNRSATINAYMGNNDVEFYVTTNEANPARIYDPGTPRRQLRIEIAEWFLRGYSAGYIAGMLCHEVGAHYMTSNALRFVDNGLHVVPVLNRTSLRFPRTRDFMNSEEWVISAGRRIIDPLTGWEYTPANARQPDHIFASCSDCARYITYRELMIEFAQIIATNADNVFVQEDLTDLIDCWLMDIASILATTDARGWGPLYARAITIAYNAHLLAMQQNVNQLTQNVNVQAAIAQMPQKWTYQTFGAYGAMITKLFRPQ